MSDLLDEDLEFRGGTLQLSTDTLTAESAENRQNNTAAADSKTKHKSKTTANSSVLSGADSLSSSTSSFTGKHKLVYF